MLDAGGHLGSVYAKAAGVAEKEAAELRETIALYERGEYTRDVSPAGRRQDDAGWALIKSIFNMPIVEPKRTVGLAHVSPAEVRKARQLIREMLGTITLAPGRGPVESRVFFTAKKALEGVAA